MAEQRRLSDGTADLVEMTRAQIADPDLVVQGVGRCDVDQIRPCVSCNQQCKVRDNRNPDRQLHW
jgi:2,4-dienoyl-CoA reductase-like NADH-dependent reductase (Old Yellow Enzyme family)